MWQVLLNFWILPFSEFAASAGFAFAFSSGQKLECWNVLVHVFDILHFIVPHLNFNTSCKKAHLPSNYTHSSPSTGLPFSLCALGVLSPSVATLASSFTLLLRLPIIVLVLAFSEPLGLASGAVMPSVGFVSMPVSGLVFVAVERFSAAADEFWPAAAVFVRGSESGSDLVVLALVILRFIFLHHLLAFDSISEYCRVGWSVGWESRNGILRGVLYDLSLYVGIFWKWLETWSVYYIPNFG